MISESRSSIASDESDVCQKHKTQDKKGLKRWSKMKNTWAVFKPANRLPWGPGTGPPLGGKGVFWEHGKVQSRRHSWESACGGQWCQVPHEPAVKTCFVIRVWPGRLAWLPWGLLSLCTDVHNGKICRVFVTCFLCFGSHLSHTNFSF